MPCSDGSPTRNNGPRLGLRGELASMTSSLHTSSSARHSAHAGAGAIAALALGENYRLGGRG
jgi:hypothetical protein